MRWLDRGWRALAEEDARGEPQSLTEAIEATDLETDPLARCSRFEIRGLDWLRFLCTSN